MQNKMINNSKNWTSQETTHDSKRAALAVVEKHGYLSVDTCLCCDGGSS